MGVFGVAMGVFGREAASFSAGRVFTAGGGVHGGVVGSSSVSSMLIKVMKKAAVLSYHPK